ncbi:hypothetical protein AVEN_219789-1 [Araneus ventricosus]|uniref:Uncharacterized protein n=1 Tax=Araneus ventricosus TaxID=182803 RepID=A0A4Y2JWR2_ARAVE|nr:hypothetical protein AVEN_219789-1 [Araneus ventricosus]
MSPLTLKKSGASKGSVSKVSLDRRRQERMCSGEGGPARRKSPDVLHPDRPVSPPATLRQPLATQTDNNLLVIAVTALSDLATQTVSRSLIMTVTALSIALSSLAFQLALQTKLQSHPLLSVASPCLTGRDVTWNYLEHSAYLLS